MNISTNSKAHDVSNFYEGIRSYLDSLKSRTQQLRFSKALMLWFASISVLTIALFFLSWIFRLPAGLRVPLLIIWVGVVILAGYILVFKTLARKISPESIALRIEECYPESQDRLISSIQLWSELNESKYGYSSDFIKKIIQEAHSFLSKIDKKRILSNDLREFRRAGFVFITTIIPLILIIAFFPSAFSNSIYAFTHPFERESLLNPIRITGVSPGNLTLSPGDSVDIIANVTGEFPEVATLHYKTQRGDWEIINLLGKDESVGEVKKATFSTKLQNLKESLKYYVSLSDVKSEQYGITIVYKPIVDNLQLELQYPKYTGMSPQTFGVNVGDVTALLGTKVLLTAKSNKDLASAFLAFDDDTNSRMEIKGSNNLNGSFIVKRSGTYYISVTDKDGQSNADPIKYSINLLLDQPPKVNIVKPGKDVEIDAGKILLMRIEAQDDYGVAKLNLHYQIQGEDEKHNISLGTYRTPQISAFLDYTWDLEPLKLFPEDVVSYYVDAYDADNVSGPNVGRSATFTLRFPSLQEMYERIEDDQTAQRDEMQDVRSKQEDVKDMVDKLISDLKKEKELDWEKRKELEQATQLQEQINEQMQNLAQEINETVEKMKENPLIGPEAMEKIQELKNLFNELATDEMKQIMQKLNEALNNMNPQQQQRDLMAASFKQEEFVQKLDRMIDLFKKMQMKQKLETALKQAEELVKQQTEIMEQTEDLAKSGVNDEKDRQKSENLGNREDRIKNQTENLLKDIDNLSDEMREQVPPIADMLDKVSKQAEKSQIPNQLQNASNELKKGDPPKSLPHQRNALSKMSQLQSDLEMVQQAMQGQDMSEITSALRDAVRSSLYLSHRHEEVIQSTMNFKSTLNKMLPGERQLIISLASDELDLSEGAKKLANQLKELSHKSTAVNPEMVWNMDRVADGLKRSALAMHDQLPMLVVSIQKNTLSVLNRSIQELLDSIDQVNSEGIPMPGVDDYMEQLRQLADQQSQLNQSTQEADNVQRKQGMTPSLEQMLEKMAAEQQLIKEATERLAGKLDKLAQTLGKLEEVAKEMQDVEENLREGSLSRETIDKQRRILTRLLEYEKSMKQQDFDRKREARVARDYISERPNTILPDEATKIRQQVDPMLSPKAQEQWPKQYRELIRMYYKALSNTVKTQSGMGR